MRVSVYQTNAPAAHVQRPSGNVLFKELLLLVRSLNQIAITGSDYCRQKEKMSIGLAIKY